MQLVFEVCHNGGTEPSATRIFDGVGGVIGRGAGCDWVIPDPSRLLSSHHGLISFREGQYFLTDISSNGIVLVGSEERLRKGQARLISDGDLFQLGLLSVRARLIKRTTSPSSSFSAPTGLIPEDAYLGLDPLGVLDLEQARAVDVGELEALGEPVGVEGQWVHTEAVDREHLIVPTWQKPDPEVAVRSSVTEMVQETEGFWVLFTKALGIRLSALDGPGREALAIKTASLFRHTMDELTQSMRTVEELKIELGLEVNETQVKNRSPLKDCMDTDATLAALLGPGELGLLPAELAITQAYRTIQVHQLSLLTACRTAMRSGREAFAPTHLLRCFERRTKPFRCFTDGARWRAYQRHYQRLIEEDPLSERQLRDDFSRAYQEQSRLVSTLHAGYPG
ncbi:type VI secretion system-associated FHA domain protein TagH [Pseudomonas sp. SDO524_S393]